MATVIKVSLRFVLPSQDKWDRGRGSPLHSCPWPWRWGKRVLPGAQASPRPVALAFGLSDLNYIVFCPSEWVLFLIPALGKTSQMLHFYIWC